MFHFIFICFYSFCFYLLFFSFYFGFVAFLALCSFVESLLLVNILVLLGSTLGADPYDPPVVTKYSLVLFWWHAVFERNLFYFLRWDCLAKDIEPD
jgi:hypothetical protein